MPVTTSLPSNKLKPGVFVEFDTSSGLRGVRPVSYRGALIGAHTSAGTQAIRTPVRVYTEDEADGYFGAGSELALMCRAAIAAGKKAGNMAELWAVAEDEPSGGTKAAFTLTVTGPATASGNLVIKVCGLLISVGVTSGDAQNTIAAAIEAAGIWHEFMAPSTRRMCAV